MIGIIGGTGLSHVNGFMADSVLRVPTGHWGDVFVTIGRLAGCRVAFIARHGQYHNTLPSEVDNIAQLVAFRQIGIKIVVSVTASGSLHAGCQPGSLVFVDKTGDKTTNRVKTIFGRNIVVGHIARAQEVCPWMHDVMVESARALHITYVERGRMVVIDGPQFSSVPETEEYRRAGYDLVGMTLQPWLRIAMEMLFHVVVAAQVTDMDNPEDGDDGVSQPEVSSHIRELSDTTGLLLCEAIPRIAEAHHTAVARCGCEQRLNGVILTDKAHINAAALPRFLKAFNIKAIPPEWFDH